MKFPFEATTKNGTQVTITGYYNGYKHPWCGFYPVKFGEKLYKLTMSWAADGTVDSAITDPDYDLISIPQQT